MLTKDAAELLRESIDFFAPYLAAAKLTGEVRKDLDVEAAGSGSRASYSRCSPRHRRSAIWTTRCPEAVADFVRAHVVRGFCGDRPRSRAASKLR
ncbi:transcriptional regulator, TetR family protein [Mycobacterium kansasii]|uniref:Transcriptional regulator, TetR family protein n=1 Tax=Mycobacterium kansasii TaxID=1768 RepID=A0A1V3XI69_MYCKA|nr:transcriptional regulator, TetR family protein [Mycobacterium kansasii]